ncbi:MAG: hypothetical protein IPN71_10815 [Fibrobacteres bacterium]|nr:hypothetical protein [Fibrobacterota bacterium]
MFLPLLATLFFSSPDTAKHPDTLSAPKPVTRQALTVEQEMVSSYERFGKWQFGVSGGTSSGGGLAVRRWFDAKNGIEMHGYAYLSKKKYPEDGDSWGSNESSDGHYYGSDTGTVASGEVLVGIVYLREVMRVHLFNAEGLFKGPNHLRGLTFVGIGGYTSYEDRDLKSPTYNYDYTYNTSTKTTNHIDVHTSSSQVLGGAGGGVEFEFGRLSVHLMVGMGGFYRFDPSEYQLGPTVDGGLFLRF